MSPRSKPVPAAIALAIASICLCLLSGCFEWSEDYQGHLQSVGVPGMPIWRSDQTPRPMNLTDFGYTPEEAAKVGGPVLVMPPGPDFKGTRYRFYPKNQNRCEQDLKKILADRASNGAGGPAPYCAENPPPPPSAVGHAFVF
jgi:hypothetical protein